MTYIVPPVVEEILVRREGRRNVPYLDTVGLWTCGIGCRLRHDESPQVPWTAAKVELRFRQIVEENEQVLREHLYSPLTDQQRWALLCFMHQFGATKFLASELRHLLSLGQYRAAADQLLRWDHEREGDKEVEVPSLLARRKEERDLFLSGTPQ